VNCESCRKCLFSSNISKWLAFDLCYSAFSYVVPCGRWNFFRALPRLHACRGRNFENRPTDPSGNECDYCLPQYEILQDLHLFLKRRPSRTFGLKNIGVHENLKIDQTDNSLVELLIYIYIYICYRHLLKSGIS
jgi:hypothetical protein